MTGSNGTLSVNGEFIGSMRTMAISFRKSTEQIEVAAKELAKAMREHKESQTPEAIAQRRRERWRKQFGRYGYLEK